MAKTMHVEIVSAEEQIFSGSAEMIFAPGVMGDLGILPNHTQLLTQLKPGEVRVKTAEGEDDYYVSGGMLEVQPHVVTVLADTVVRAHDLDEAAAIEAKERAEQQLQDKAGEFDYAQAESELAEALAQIKAIRRMRDNSGH